VRLRVPVQSLVRQSQWLPVDLAKKLDTFDIIDLKVCETTMESLEIDRNQIPTFIEPVPFAPNEIKRLSDDGYTHL